MVAAATVGPSAYWYLTRSTGIVALLLLSLSVALGVLDVSRWRSPRFPRFVVDSLHRSASLLVIVFLALHVLTAVLDSFAAISLLDALVPFGSRYRPVWVGLGAVSFDLLVAVAITSLVRQRLGYRAWRAVHWLSYACWPVAVVHALGTGSDVKSVWLLGLCAAGLAAVVAATISRALRGWPEHARMRTSAVALSFALVVGLVVWLPVGPLGRNWARRSGTPASLLGRSAPASRSGAKRSSASRPRAAAYRALRSRGGLA